MSLREQIEKALKPFIHCSQDNCDGCKTEIDMATTDILDIFKDSLPERNDNKKLCSPYKEQKAFDDGYDEGFNEALDKILEQIDGGK